MFGGGENSWHDKHETIGYGASMIFRIVALLFVIAAVEATAIADPSDVTIRIENDDHNDLFVTIQDENTSTHRVVWDAKRLNDGATEEVVVTANGSGKAHLIWSAKRATNTDRCGKGEAKDIAEGESVSISASDTC
jgi:hypothetical protein